MEEPIGECLICARACEPEAQMRGALAGDLFGVCPRCRADAALGRAVRMMPDGSSLIRVGREWVLQTMDRSVSSEGWSLSPEAALQAAGMMEVEK